MVFSDFRKLRLGATSADVWQNWLKILGSLNPSIKKEGRGAHRHKYSKLQRCALIGWEATYARYLQVFQQVIHLYFNHLKKLQLHWKKKQTSIEIKRSHSALISFHFNAFRSIFFNYKETTVMWHNIIVHSYLVTYCLKTHSSGKESKVTKRFRDSFNIWCIKACKSLFMRCFDLLKQLIFVNYVNLVFK